MQLIRRITGFFKTYFDELTLFSLSVFLFLVATNTQSGWLYFVVSFILGLLIFSAVTSFVNLQKISVSRSFSDDVREGEPLEVTLKVKNNGVFPKFFILAEDHFPTPEPDAKPTALLFTHIPPGGHRRLSYRATPYQRGVYDFSELTVKTSGFLGFMTLSGKVKVSGPELVVFPRLLEPGSMNLRNRSQTFGPGDRTYAFNGRSHDFIGIRDYQPGHETRFIHWASTARHNKLMVKEFNEISNPSMTVIIETRREAVLGTGRDTTLEYMVRAASTLLNRYSMGKVSYNLLFAENGSLRACRNLSPRKGDTELARISPDGSVPLENLLDGDSLLLENSHHIYIFKVLPFDSMESLRNLARKRMKITVLFFDGESFVAGEGGGGLKEYMKDMAVLQSIGVDARIYYKDQNLGDTLAGRKLSSVS